MVAGRRGRTGALLVLDRTASAVQDQILVVGVTATPRVLPPADLDGDGHAETALFTGSETLLARLMFTPATVDLSPLEWWTCGTSP